MPRTHLIYLLFIIITTINLSLTKQSNKKILALPLSDNASVHMILQTAKAKTNINLNALVDPMNTLTIIFENKLPSNSINPITRTGFMKTIENSYGVFKGELAVETIMLNDISIRLRILIVKDTVGINPIIIKNYDAILGIAFNRVTEYSIYNNIKPLQPYIRYNKKERMIYIGEKPTKVKKSKTSISSYISKPLKLLNGFNNNNNMYVYFNIASFQLNTTNQVEQISNMKCKFDLFNKDLILFQPQYEDILKLHYFPYTTMNIVDNAIFEDNDSNSDLNYKNYFYSVKNVPNTKTQTTFVSSSDEKMKFDFWYLENDVYYSKIKVMKHKAEFCDVGMDVFGFDNVEIDYDMKEVWFYDDSKVGGILIGVVGGMSVFGIGLYIFFFGLEKERRSLEEGMLKRKKKKR